jgi:predicted glutamine amidotransferase
VCRLFGLSAAPHRIHARFWLLEAPDSLATQSRHNADGTGLGFFEPDGTPMLDKEPIAAYQDRDFTGEARHISSTTFIGHVRRASTGGLTTANCHPFAIAGRMMAHNGAIGDLPRLEQQLGDHRRAVQGDTDSERILALITSYTDENGGDVAAAIVRAASWLAENVPLFSINLIVATAGDLWALRYPETHRLFVLQREAGGPHGFRPLQAGSATLRVHSEHLSQRASVVVASEPLDDHPDWRLLEVGELLHVAGDLAVTSRTVLAGPPAHPMSVTYLHSPSAAQT